MKKKFKFNWGWGILLTIILFMGLTMVRVLYFMNQDVNLVTDHYYDKEIKFQQQIDMEKRAARLKDGIDVKYSGNMLNVVFPKLAGISGDLYFYRPADYRDDFKVPIKIDDSYIQTVNISKIRKGYWKLQINWSDRDTSYYTEKSLMIE